MAWVFVGLLQVGWLGWFVTVPLPNIVNAGGKGVSRLTVLIRTFPHVVPELRFAESFFGIAVEGLSHVANLSDRLPILLAAALIAGSALSTGDLVLRLLGLRLGMAERVAGAYGLGASTLGVATLGLGRLGWLSPILIRSALAAPIVATLLLAIGRRRAKKPMAAGFQQGWSRLGFAAVTGPFVALMILGAMLPTIEFDATEYHLQGPKEYYQAGRIAFLPHNVYTSMPFGVEMLHLLGMEVLDDWWRGALVGQVLIALFAPATAAMIVLAARNLGTPRAAWVAGVVYLTTPWVSRLAVNPFVEGPLCFHHAALIWVATRRETSDSPTRLGLLAGLFAGGAMAIKYPGLISAVLPFGLWALHESRRTREWRVAAAYALGGALVAGPWLARNATDTGNPVYPLSYGLFGGRDWDPASDAKWSAVHGPRSIEVASFWKSFVEVAGESDWQTPLIVLLAPLAFLKPTSRRAVVWLTAYSAYLFLTWWTLTHRLDRFWLPILAPLVILAGMGSDRLGAVWLGCLLTIAVGTNAALCETDLVGSTARTRSLADLRSEVPIKVNRAMSSMDLRLPPGARVLLIGQAGVFHLARPILYNTVFDRDLFESIARDRPAEEVREALRKLGVDYIYVDWSEIGRYRSPGNYGFTDFETPEIFGRLVAAKVLAGPDSFGSNQVAYRVLPAGGRPK